MKRLTQKSKMKSRGFSLMELLVVMLLMSIIVGAVVEQIAMIQQRSRTEQAKVDIFQESRDFVDQFVRDAHAAGYPSIRMFDTASWTTALASPNPWTDSRLAAGITFIGPGEIKFEGDVEGDAKVDVVDYVLVATGNNCPCLRRGAVDKATVAAAFSNEVENVQSAGTTADPIFVGYTASGTAVTSADTTTVAGQQALATIKTVLIRLKTKSAVVDPRTGQAPETTLSGQVTIVNCSLTATGQANSCS
jgi:prepilin-type N-terminal cleavage/methylation domain-containing protein